MKVNKKDLQTRNIYYVGTKFYMLCRMKIRVQGSKHYDITVHIIQNLEDNNSTSYGCCED